MCAGCGGLWMSKDDPREAVRKPPPEGSEQGTRVGLETPLWEESPLRCPSCQTPMAKGRYAYSSGVTIDRCERCSGIWLDRGELARLREFVHRKVPLEKRFQAELQALALKRRAKTMERAEAGSGYGGVSARYLLNLLKDLFS